MPMAIAADALPQHQHPHLQFLSETASASVPCVGSLLSQLSSKSLVPAPAYRQHITSGRIPGCMYAQCSMYATKETSLAQTNNHCRALHAQTLLHLWWCHPMLVYRQKVHIVKRCPSGTCGSSCSFRRVVLRKDEHVGGRVGKHLIRRTTTALSAFETHLEILCHGINHIHTLVRLRTCCCRLAMLQHNRSDLYVSNGISSLSPVPARRLPSSASARAIERQTVPPADSQAACNTSSAEGEIAAPSLAGAGAASTVPLP